VPAALALGSLAALVDHLDDGAWTQLQQGTAIVGPTFPAVQPAARASRPPELDLSPEGSRVQHHSDAPTLAVDVMRRKESATANRTPLDRRPQDPESARNSGHDAIRVRSDSAKESGTLRVWRIGIQAYRSLYDVQLTPQPMTVLVGPNNAGKTNVMEAIHFLSEVYEFDLETAINRKGGFENIAHRRMRRTKRPVHFQISASLSIDEALVRRVPSRPGGPVEENSQTIEVQHQFEFRASGQRIEADYAVVLEVIRFVYRSSRTRRALLTVTRRAGQPLDISVLDRSHLPSKLRTARERSIVDPFDNKSYRDFLERQSSDTSLLITTMRFNSAIATFLRSLAATQLYQLAPLEVRRPGVPTPNADLARHGGNLPALIANMRRERPSAWEHILQAMQRVVPQLEDIKTGFTPDRLLTLQFVERGVGRPWSVDEVSDGTIQSLALFATVFDPRSPLLLIEEPENSVHPWILRVFVEVCRAANKQIIISTHSPALINSLLPEELFIVWREQGRTEVQALKEIEPDARDMWERGDTGIFDLVDSGWLKQAVPGDHQ
jgi:predicted ATPase